MVATLDAIHIELKSGPYWKRTGLWPQIAIVGMTWIFVVMWLVVAVWVFRFNPYWSVTLLASTLAFSSLLGLMSYKMISDGFREFVLELTDTEAVLSVVDKLRKRKSVQMVLLNDVKFAEYYPFQDSASIILHAEYTDMEVPLWPLGSTGKDVVDFLEGRGVKVVNVQSDDIVPD